MLYKENNVYEESLERVRFLYDKHDDIIVSMSGGKDSTVLLHLAMTVAREKGRLPVKVFWLDQEAEWRATGEYMAKVMHDPDVKPYWFQIPFDFTNSLSHACNFLRVWDENKPDEWIRPKDDISIKHNPSKENRFHPLVNTLPQYCTESENCAVIVGMKISESLNRRVTIAYGDAHFEGITWCKKKTGKTQVFWPIYDWEDSDIWTCIYRNSLEYNKVYDMQYRWGLARKNMRVSALIHETAWHSIEMLHEFEPDTYAKFCRRIPGVNAFDHFGKEIMVKDLPFAFKDWREYRDYLLVTLIKPEYHCLFRRRWEKQNTEEWYKVHVKELLVNDIDGTINSNAKSRIRRNDIIANDNRYRKRDNAQFEAYMGVSK